MCGVVVVFYFHVFEINKDPHLNEKWYGCEIYKHNVALHSFIDWLLLGIWFPVKNR